MLQRIFQDKLFPEISLQGERLLLRPPMRRDCESWIRVREDNRAFLEPWTPKWPETSLTDDHYMDRLRDQAAECQAGRGYYFLICLQETGELVGGINLNRITRGVAQMGTLGYWMARPHNGRGYMTEAVGLVVDFAFEALKLHRLEAGCLPHNAASSRVLEKAGFTYEGLARKYLKIAGQWQDHALYALVQEDRA